MSKTHAKIECGHSPLFRFFDYYVSVLDLEFFFFFFILFFSRSQYFPSIGFFQRCRCNSTTRPLLTNKTFIGGGQFNKELIVHSYNYHVFNENRWILFLWTSFLIALHIVFKIDFIRISAYSGWSHQLVATGQI